MAPPVTRELLVVYGSLAVNDVEAGNGVYNLEASQPLDWVKVGLQINVYGCANAANNGTFTVSTIVGNKITTNNSASVLEAASAGLIGFPVGGTSDFEPTGKIKREKNYTHIKVSFEAVFAGVADDATFLKYQESIEGAFHVPYQRLRILHGTTVINDWNPAAATGANTGFNQNPSISKQGSKHDSSRSRKYDISVELDLPADYAGRSGRQQETIAVDYDESNIRTVNIEGVYTAIGSNDARQQYFASIAAFVVEVLTDYGGSGSYNLIAQQHSEDTENKICRFRRAYKEIIYAEYADALNHAAIINAQFAYTRHQVAPGDSRQDVRRLEEIAVSFDCGVDKSQTTDVYGLWNDTVRPYLISQAKSIFSLGACALVDIAGGVTKSGNRIRATLTIMAVSESNVVQLTRTVRIEDLSGKVLTPAIDGAGPLSKHVYNGPGNLRRITTVSMVALEGSGGGGGGAGGTGAGGGISGGGGFSFGGGQSVGIFGKASGAATTALVQAALSDGDVPAQDQGAAPAAETGWVRISYTLDTTPKYIGLPPDQLQLSETVSVTVEEYVTSPAGGGGGGPPGGVAT